ncbi:SIR2 family NAD-dependent protein deacylase [Acrocarpospora macrocephala]|nr:SIR2 family protein [Acrocarpospora macrocephala]
MKDADWERLISQLRKGACTPFLGAGACAGSLPSGAQLSERLAARWGYPFGDRANLTKVTHYGAMKFGESIHVKEQVCAELAAAGVPDFSDPLEPHGLLAGFPFPVYLTTNYDDFIYQSLKAAGKDPNVALCPWHGGLAFDEDLFRHKAGWNPGPDAPLIYHLHGRIQDPSSLVITEDDYLEFVFNLAYDRAAETPIMLPAAVMRALTTRSLLFVGYSLQDWTFRFLFNSLHRAVPGINRRRHISVQLAPSVDGTAVGDLQRELQRYYEDWKVSIFWGTPAQFCEQLRERMGTIT